MTMPGGTETTSSKPKWYARRWVQIVAALLVGAAFGSQQANADADKATKLQAAAESRADAAEKQVSTAEAARDQAVQDASTAQSKAEDAVRAKFAARQADLDAKAAALVARERKVTGAEAAAKAGTFDGDGTYRVGADIQPGTYKAAAAAGCYYARLRNLGSGFDAIIANNNTDGPVIVTIRPSDAGFTATRCAEFHKVG